MRFERFRQTNTVVLDRCSQGVLDLASGAEIALILQGSQQVLGQLESERGDAAICGCDCDGGELILRHDTEANPDTGLRIFQLLLQAFGEGLVALAGDDSQGVRIETLYASASLVHAKAQAASDRLPPLAFGAELTQGADLEDVWVVPALA